MTTKQTDQVAIELMAMSDAEFKRKYLVPIPITPEQAWTQAQVPTSAPDEGEHHNVTVAGGELAPPSDLPYIKTWGVGGWK